MPAMHRAHGGREENVYRLAHELLTPIAEQALDLGIDQDDLAGTVGYDYAVRTGFEGEANDVVGSDRRRGGEQR
jgi:hypothetical protein